MKNNLEEFIRSNRAAFDDQEPSSNSWRKIKHQVFGVAESNAMMYWRAAAIFFMALSAYLMYPKFSETREKQVVMNEFKDVESFYVREISQRIEMIDDFTGGGSGLNGYTNDFVQLEAMYEVLKDEMQVRPSKKVKDALVLNLLVRMDLLNRQLEKLEKESESESPAKRDSAKQST
jgi:hypothetical protein